MRRYCWMYGAILSAFGLGIVVGGLLTAVLVKWFMGILCIALGVVLLRG